MNGHDTLVLGVMYAVVGCERQGDETTWADELPTITAAQKIQARLAADDIASHIEIDTDWRGAA